MEDSERVAVAAHLHVVLRRKTGRVTDTEWMACNQAYAQAMVAFALEHAREQQDEEPGAPGPASAGQLERRQAPACRVCRDRAER